MPCRNLLDYFDILLVSDEPERKKPGLFKSARANGFYHISA